MVGIDHATGQQQRVVIGGSSLVESLVDLDLVAPVFEVPAFDFATLRLNYFSGCACFFENHFRIGQLYLLKAISRENRDLLSLQFVSHYFYSIVGGFALAYLFYGVRGGYRAGRCHSRSADSGLWITGPASPSLTELPGQSRIASDARPGGRAFLLASQFTLLAPQFALLAAELSLLPSKLTLLGADLALHCAEFSFNAANP